MKKNFAVILFIIANFAFLTYLYFPIIKHMPKTKKVTVQFLDDTNRNNQQYILPLLRFHYKNGAIADCNILILLGDFVFIVLGSQFLKRQSLK